MADKCLREAFKDFDPVSELSDLELGWYTSAARMAEDDVKLKNAEGERKRRSSGKKDSMEDAAVLPAVKAGALKKVA
jgi:hypothetical protein